MGFFGMILAGLFNYRGYLWVFPPPSFEIGTFCGHSVCIRRHWSSLATIHPDIQLECNHNTQLICFVPLLILKMGGCMASVSEQSDSGQLFFILLLIVVHQGLTNHWLVHFWWLSFGGGWIPFHNQESRIAAAHPTIYFDQVWVPHQVSVFNSDSIPCPFLQRTPWLHFLEFPFSCDATNFSGVSFFALFI